MKRPPALLFLLALMAQSSLTSAASIGTGGISTAFSRGTTSLAVTAGTGNSFNDNYFVLGLGVGYYVAQGLELGIDAQYWMSGSPTILKISPQIRYVFTQPKVVKPYLGAFYRSSFIDSDTFDDMSSWGARAGVYFNAQGNSHVGLGLVYESYNDCRYDCTNTYPEVLFSVAF